MTMENSSIKKSEQCSKKIAALPKPKYVCISTQRPRQSTHTTTACLVSPYRPMRGKTDDCILAFNESCLAQSQNAAIQLFQQTGRQSHSGKCSLQSKSTTSSSSNISVILIRPPPAANTVVRPHFQFQPFPYLGCQLSAP